MFFLTSFSGKLKLVFAAFLVFALVVTTAPESVINRYKTLWEDNTDEDGNLDEATMSALGRKELLFESIRQTFVHPIFGLGAGNFPVAYSKKLESEGIFHHGYRASHNSYTQISSETGIPGLVFFLTAMGWCFRHTIRLYRGANKSPGQKQIANLAISVFLSLLTFSVTAFFSSQGYRFYLPLLAGLTVALKNAVEQSRATPGILRV
jgi:O-antigen ligase